MRTMTVVELDVLAEDVIQVPEAEAHEVIEAFSLDRANPRLSVSVCVRCPDRRPDDSSAGIAKQLIESRSELRVAVAD